MPINLYGYKLHFNYSRKIILKNQNNFKLVYLANKNKLYFKSLIKNPQQTIMQHHN